MSDKTKNIITVIVGLLLVIFICWYIVLAWELRASKDVISEFQTTIDWIKDVRAKIAENVKLFRNKKHLKREELSLILGFDNSYISKLERKTINITIDKLAKIADYFEIDIIELLK